MKRAIITGATGAVGIALIHELITNNIEVLVFCREGSKRNEKIPKHELVSLKVCSLDQLSTVKNDTGNKYDFFFHLAWAGTTGSERNDMYLQNQNIQYALDAVGAANRFGCKVFIGAGSQAEYGRVESKLKPDTPTFPENGYGYAKLCAGLMTRTYAHQLGMEHIWVRLLSVYGPGDGNQSLVMSVVNSLKSGEVPRCTKGEQIWDYLYSGDAARAFRLAAEKGVDGKTYVLGSGHGRLLAEYILDIRDVVNPEMEIAFGDVPYGPNQVMFLCADISELEKDTGWMPSIDFKRGIETIVE
ncbi:MAG: NAD-dependent epimerase/dehydratase family protein [Lachnospiraceae bacterium]|nr:NAD-dependent epimerase/dehydratase family protein [Lachnospiraceae bacterium]